MIPNSSSARALLALLFASCVTSASVFAGTLIGTIRSAETGQPLGSKVVAAYDTSGTLRGSATSDQTGTYLLPLPAGSYRVLAYDLEGIFATSFDGNAESFETSPLTTVGAADTVRRDFTLVVGGSISGIVVGSNGTAREGVVVEAYNLSGTRRGFTATSVQGSYAIVLPPGGYKIVAYDPSGNYSFSFYPEVRTFVDAARVDVVAGRITTAIDFRLDVAGRLSGTVVDLGTGLPLGGIDVYAYTPAGVGVISTTTDATGAFRLSLPPGDYRLVAADPARHYATGFYGLGRAFDTSPMITLTAGGSQANVQLGLLRAATIAGKVRDAAGAPVASVTAAAYNLDGTLHASALTKADGTYELLVAPGTYKLVVFDPQLVYATAFFGGTRDFTSSGSIGVAAGQRIHGFDLTVIRGGRVIGTVRDGGQPRAGITVAAYDPAGILTASTTTAADGTYALVVPPGSYRIVAFDNALRYAPAYDLGAGNFDQTVPRAVAAGASVTADLSLRRGVMVLGDVVDANGHPLSGVNVFALDASGHRVSGGLAMDGTFALAVPAGSYKFAAIDPSGRYVVVYYEHATTLSSATWVTVSTTQSPRLRFMLEPVLRRRVVRH